MWENKIHAFLERGVIRDAYDLEFLYKKGQGDIKNLSEKDKKELIRLLDSFSKKDFKIRLGSLLEADERKIYIESGFKILKNALDRFLM